MTTLLFTAPAFAEHRTPPGHPERADRIRAVWRALEAPAFAALQRRDALPADPALCRLAHDPDHVERVVAMAPREGYAAFDSDTIMASGSLDAALAAVGGAIAAVDAVMAGTVSNAFVAARPPGHHAERDRAMGFCFFNQVAIAARHARRQHGAERIAIVDWDVHHGNGTQDIFWSDASVLFASTHQMPLYPGTGDPSERGEHGTIVNVALSDGDDGQRFREAMRTAVLPRVAAHRPDLVIISAGFDAHHRDPLGGLRLTEADFAWATEELLEIAGRSAGGRIVSVLEGGYDLDGLSSSVAAHVRVLMGA